MRLSSYLSCLVLSATALVSVARAATFDLGTANIADINAAFDAGALSSEKLVGLYLKRIEAYDKQGPKINSVITLNTKALEEARALDAERKTKGPRSPLHGIPVVLKDLIDATGMPTTAGFKPFNAPVPPRDAFITEKLKAAGAIILAKVSTLNWFGKGFDDTHPIGITLNPYNTAHFPGGSSNGTGASIASYFATVGIGTDTGGSVQIPSAYCSLAGMVATQGLVSRAGIVPRGGTQDRAGPMGRNVYDIATTLSVIAGWDAEDLITLQAMGHFPQSDWAKELGKPSLKGKRIGVLREMVAKGPEHEAGKALFEQALDDMRKAGAVIVDPVLTGLDLLYESQSSVGRTAEYEKIGMQNAYLAHLGSAAPYKSVQEMMTKVGYDKFEKPMVAALTLPAPEKSDEYLSRQKNRSTLIRLVTDTVARLELDALVLPFSTIPPPPISGGGSGLASYQSLSSNTGIPSVIMPAGYTKDNLPIAIQFVSANFEDLTLLKIAAGYEAASKRRKNPESVPALPGERFDY
ncbi:MAG: amidase family protein [Nibricoccus sp.]